MRRHEAERAARSAIHDAYAPYISGNATLGETVDALRDRIDLKVLVAAADAETRAALAAVGMPEDLSAPVADEAHVLARAAAAYYAQSPALDRLALLRHAETVAVPGHGTDELLDTAIASLVALYVACVRSAARTSGTSQPEAHVALERSVRRRLLIPDAPTGTLP